MINSETIKAHIKQASEIEKVLIEIAMERVRIRLEGEKINEFTPALNGFFESISYDEVVIENPHHDEWSDELNDYDHRSHITLDGQMTASVTFGQYGKYGYYVDHTEKFSISLVDDPNWAETYRAEIQAEREAERIAKENGKEAAKAKLVAKEKAELKRLKNLYD